MTYSDYSEALDEYRKIAKEHKLNPDLLKEILRLSARGYNKADLADKIGVTRQTVHRYLKIVKEEISGDEFQKLLIGLIILLGGAYILKSIFGGDQND